jgi:hypothetical protein
MRTDSMLTMSLDLPAQPHEMLSIASFQAENSGRSPVLAAAMLPIFSIFHSIKPEMQPTFQN